MISKHNKSAAELARKIRGFVQVNAEKIKLPRFISGHVSSPGGVTVTILSRRNVSLEQPLEMRVTSAWPLAHWKVRLLNRGMECLVMKPPLAAEDAPVHQVDDSPQRVPPHDKAPAKARNAVHLIAPMPFMVGWNDLVLEFRGDDSRSEGATHQEAPSPRAVHEIDLGYFKCRSEREEEDRNELEAAGRGGWGIFAKARLRVRAARKKGQTRARISELAGRGFYYFNSPERLGHLMMDTLVRVAEDIVQDRQDRLNAVWVFPQCSYVLNHGFVRTKGKIANLQLVRMLGRRLEIPDSIYAEDLFRAGARNYEIRQHQHRDVHGALRSLPALLQFTEQEAAAAQSQMQAMGLPPGARYVVLHLREKGYEAGLYGRDYSTTRYSYRNPDWESYRKSVEWLAGQGYHVILMGAEVEDSAALHENVIRYAGKFRTELMDLWLCAGCVFFIGTTSGSWSLPAAFKRPILYTNFFPYPSVHAWEDGSMVLFQKVVETQQGADRTLKVGEVLETPELGSIHLDLFPDFWAGRRLVPNTEQEIFDAVVEMKERAEETWVENESDRALKEAFWSCFSANPLNSHYRIHVSAAFLRSSGVV